MRVPWGYLGNGIGCIGSVFCEAWGCIGSEMLSLEVPWRCHRGAIRVLGVSWRCLEDFMGWGPQCVMGVPWYSVMGYHEEALEVQ